MKNLPCLLLLAAPASLAALAAAATFGAPIPFGITAGHLVAATASAGVLAMFCHEYVPRRRARPTPAKAPARPAPAIDRAPDAVLATLGLANDPATVSLT